jgi:geranylgeranyl diphosphate synthase, type II
MDLKRRLAEYKSIIDSELARQLSLESEFPPPIREAMLYSVLNGGKRLRPVLAIATGEMYGQTVDKLLPVCVPLEFVQSFTLIHDDLPCMDNAALRRGKASLHIAYGEANAVLVGDALLNLAFGSIAREGEKNFPSDRVLKVIIELSDALGTTGVMGGQVLDLDPSSTKGNFSSLVRLHQMKTASFFKASLRMGAILADAPSTDLDKLTKYSEEFGLAFQISDDILDATGSIEEIGKDAGQDASLERTSYISEYGIDGARREAQNAVDRAKVSISGLPKTDFLVALVDYLVDRRA